MNKAPYWTVVVLYPNQKMTYIAFVQAVDAVSARHAGALEAQRAQPVDERRKLLDWVPLLVFEGIQYPKLYHWQSPYWGNRT